MLGDIDDQASIDKVVSQAEVVLSLAGPYARIGTPIVDASVRMGSHYCDITGEATDRLCGALNSQRSIVSEILFDARVH